MKSYTPVVEKVKDVLARMILVIRIDTATVAAVALYVSIPVMRMAKA